MENIKSDRWIYTPESHFPILFRFTADETKTLKNVLRAFDKDKVQSFISCVSSLPYIPLLVVFRKRIFPKNAVEGDLKSLRQCRKKLEEMLRGFDPDPQRNINSTRDPKIRMGESPWDICCENAKKALPHIQTIEKTLEEVLTKNKRGRRRPQADQEGFVCEVAKLYKGIFNKEPSKAKNGIFCELINYLFDIVFNKEDEEDGKVYNKSKTVERVLDKLHAG